MERKAASRIMVILVLANMLAIAFNMKSVVATASARTPQFWLLSVEKLREFDQSDGQFLIKELLKSPNWNNSTEYTSYIHLLSEYTSEEVDDQIRPYLYGIPSRSNVESEMKSFLAQAVPDDIVVFYIECHGVGGSLWDPRISYSELADWLCSGGLQYAFVTVVLDTCQSGSSIRDGEGGVLGPNRNVLCACRSSESASGWCGEWQGFSHFITEGFGLCEDGNNDGWVSAAEVFEYAKPRTEDWIEAEFGWGQHPVSYYGQVEGNIPLVQRDVTLPFHLEKPLGMSADMVRQEAWPEHHHFVLSRDGDPLVDDGHGTPGFQTLYGKFTNTGNVTIPAGSYSVVWNISSSTGSSRIVFTVGPQNLTPGRTVILRYHIAATDLAPGKYRVEAWCYYHYYESGETTRTFSFTVAS